MSRKEETGRLERRCDIGVDFLNGFKFGYGKPGNLDVTSLESCQLGIGPNIRLALWEDIEWVGEEGVKGVTRNSPSTWRRPVDLVWVRVRSSWLLGRRRNVP